jgi:hypothetical protein
MYSTACQRSVHKGINRNKQHRIRQKHKTKLLNNGTLNVVKQIKCELLYQYQMMAVEVQEFNVHIYNFFVNLICVLSFFSAIYE